MNKTLIELLEKVSGTDLILAILFIIVLLSILLSQKSKITELLDKWRKDKNEEDSFHSLVYDMKSSIESLSSIVKQNQENRDKELLHYRDDSRRIRDEMYKVMNQQSESI